MGDSIRQSGQLPQTPGLHNPLLPPMGTPASVPDALKVILPQTQLHPVDALRVAHRAPSSMAVLAAMFPDTAPQQKLGDVSMAELQKLGAKSNKKAFFEALLPGAIQSERAYGVPASVILAQAALESGWGKHAIGGYNLFGIKGEGTAGSRVAWTSETLKNGRKVRVKAAFAQFRNFADAVKEHGQVFHNGNFDKALAVFKQTLDPNKFIDAMARTYATSRTYAADLKAMLVNHGLRDLCAKMGGH